jgi:hypothetical protein
MPLKQPIIVYTVVSEPDADGYRTERMALHPDLPATETTQRTHADRRRYRMVWRESAADLAGAEWVKSCLGTASSPRCFEDEGTADEALAWLLEGEEQP